MPKSSKMSIDIEKLKEMYENMKHRPEIQVGVFASSSSRKKGGLTNADLAAIHEYGSPAHHLPPRSMLKVPIKDHIAEIMAPLRGQAVKLVNSKGSMALWKSIGIAAEKVVLQAFATGGFGKWAPLTRGTLLAKLKGSLHKRQLTIGHIMAGNVGMGILIDSGQLRRAFSSRVRMKF